MSTKQGMRDTSHRASAETVSKMLWEAVVTYHKMHYLDCRLPHYLDGIHFELEYDPHIYTDDVIGHKFALYRMELPLTQKVVMGYIGMQYHRLIYYKQIVYTDRRKYKLIGYEVKSVRLENK